MFVFCLVCLFFVWFVCFLFVCLFLLSVCLFVFCCLLFFAACLWCYEFVALFVLFLVCLLLVLLVCYLFLVWFWNRKNKSKNMQKPCINKSYKVAKRRRSLLAKYCCPFPLRIARSTHTALWLKICHRERPCDMPTAQQLIISTDFLPQQQNT